MKIKEILISDIFQGEQLIRDVPEDDSIGELAESIERNGLLQPIGVKSAEDGRYQLLWGDRRLKAHLRLHKDKITAHIYADDVESVKSIALVENLQRAALTLTEEVQAVKAMVEEGGMSVERIASAVSKSRSWVLNRLMVPDLPGYLRDPLLAGDLPISHVEIIGRVPDPAAQNYLVAMCLQNRWNRSQLKTIADCYQSAEIPAQPSARAVPGVNPMPPQAPFMYTCEMCLTKGELQEFDLVRVHKDGIGCRTAPARPVGESDRSNGMEGHSDQPRRLLDETPDREA